MEMIVICYRRIGNRKNGSFTNETKNRTAKISIKAYYWNGSTWKSSDSSSVTINNTKADYSVTLSVSANKPLYVRLSKTDYTGYYAKGTLTIE